MDNDKVYTEWFEFAKRDLESAKFLMNILNQYHIEYKLGIHINQMLQKIENFVRDKIGNQDILHYY